MSGEAQRQELTSADDFAVPIGTGMRTVARTAAAEFDPETAEHIRQRLDEFDAVRTKGDVESRTVQLGGPGPQ